MEQPTKPGGGPTNGAAGGGPANDAADGAAVDAGGSLRRAHVIVEGHVQGVWFRDTTREEALRLGVAGWVRNLPDGRVEAVFEGPPAAVSALLGWTRRGPEHAVVTHIEMREEPPAGERGFRVRA
jgi:acylphosphatase